MRVAAMVAQTARLVVRPMKLVWIMPGITAALNIGAAAVYLSQGDWRRAGYWLAAAAITFFVTV